VELQNSWWSSANIVNPLDLTGSQLPVN
jgi:hypothetical protein